MRPIRERDLRIDFLRGMAIFIIAINHYTGLAGHLDVVGAVRIYTTSHIGWSSAAEPLMFFSGYVFGIVYLSVYQKRGMGMAFLKAAHRAWQLYVIMLFTLLGLIAFAVYPFGRPEIVEFLRLGYVLDDPLMALSRFVTMTYTVTFFTILNVYIMFLLAAPWLLPFVEKRPWVALAISGGLWAAVQAFPGFNLTSLEGVYEFNPFAWQFIFIIGLVMGAGRFLEVLSAKMDWRGFFALGAALFAISAWKAMKKVADFGMFGMGDWADFFATPFAEFTNLEPLRLLHFLILMAFVYALLPASRRLNEFWIARQFMRCGQQSLECYCLSIVTSVLLATVVAELNGGLLLYLVFCAVNLAIVFAASHFVAWMKSSPWATPKATAQTNPAASPSTPDARRAA